MELKKIKLSFKGCWNSLSFLDGEWNGAFESEQDFLLISSAVVSMRFKSIGSNSNFTEWTLSERESCLFGEAERVIGGG